jgi:hypothetical protein
VQVASPNRKVPAITLWVDGRPLDYLPAYITVKPNNERKRKVFSE